MKRVLIRSGWFSRNTLQWYAGSDDIGAHVIQLVKELKELEYDVVFAGDKNATGSFDIELHLERQFSFFKRIKKILVLSEPEFVQPQNIIYFMNKYNYIIDWRTDRNYDEKRICYKYPRDLNVELFMDSPSFLNRNILISCITSNKNTLLNSAFNLYEKRQQYIEDFSLIYKKRFELFGGGWNFINHPRGIFWKVLFRIKFLSKFFTRKDKLTSYLGRCESKSHVMRSSKFTLCIENSSAPGGISEKLIDCFQHGSIPLYLGPIDIDNLIPSGLIVDLRKFKSIDELVFFIDGFKEKEYEEWRQLLVKNALDISRERGIKQYVSIIIGAIERSLSETK